MKRLFPGSKVGNSGPDGYKSLFKISRNKKQSSKFLGYKKYVELRPPGGEGGVPKSDNIKRFWGSNIKARNFWSQIPPKMNFPSGKSCLGR